ncbi:MAG: hypothetical protein M3Y08_06305 [Fibrobacterota bacterium]|nr:hypothetical protein [Fibrobacterota bacterium]
MMRPPAIRCILAFMAFIAFMSLMAPAPAAETTPGGSSINQAAAFYHQGKFDSALANLEVLKGMGPWKRRDSLSFFQYLGMSSARLGREAEAAGYFQGLLGLDSLFQFPRNEDPLVAKAFQRAREDRLAQSSLPPSGTGATAASADMNGKISMVDSGRVTGTVSAQRGTEKSAGIGLAMGAIPLGGGWLARHKIKHGMSLGLLQAGGIVLSLYASARVTREAGDGDGIRDEVQLSTVENWQWVQRISLSTALGAYLFSLIASAGD